MFRVDDQDEGRVRALLAADLAFHRARQLRRSGVTALALAGAAVWGAWIAGSGSIRHVVLAVWLVLAVFTTGAVVAELVARRRLDEALEKTRR